MINLLMINISVLMETMKLVSKRIEDTIGKLIPNITVLVKLIRLPQMKLFIVSIKMLNKNSNNIIITINESLFWCLLTLFLNIITDSLRLQLYKRNKKTLEISRKITQVSLKIQDKLMLKPILIWYLVLVWEVLMSGMQVLTNYITMKEEEY